MTRTGTDTNKGSKTASIVAGVFTTLAAIAAGLFFLVPNASAGVENCDAADVAVHGTVGGILLDCDDNNIYTHWRSGVAAPKAETFNGTTEVTWAAAYGLNARSVGGTSTEFRDGGYNLEKRVDGGSWEYIGSTRKGTLRYTDIADTAGSVEYRIRGYINKDRGRSMPKNLWSQYSEASVAVQVSEAVAAPATPTNLTVTDVFPARESRTEPGVFSKAYLAVQWDTDPSVDGYDVYRNGEFLEWRTPGTGDKSGIAQYDVLDGEEYTYEIVAVQNIEGGSVYSERSEPFTIQVSYTPSVTSS